MANLIFDSAKQKMLQTGLALDTTNIKAVLVDTGAYTFSSAHANLSDIGAGARIATSGNFASKTVTNGVFNAANLTFTAVSGASVEALVIYSDSGVAGTSYLVTWFDTVTGLPVTPNGGDINVTWDTGTNKIFKL